MTATGLARSFPIGSTVTLEELTRDPYPTYSRMQSEEPISWVSALGMYYVVRYEDVLTVLKDPLHYAVGTEQSTLFDTFGTQMLTVDNEFHGEYRSAFQPYFLPSVVRAQMQERIAGHVDRLLDGFRGLRQVELRSELASRLPILTMLSLLGLPLEREVDLRGWYDSFEEALANFEWRPDVRETARGNVQALREVIQEAVDHYRLRPDPSVLLSNLANADSSSPLSDEAIQRNTLIVLFGGISTVEALLLNAVFALSAHPETLERVRTDRTLIPATLDETMRWSGPVQSATRHVVTDTTLAGVKFAAGDIVNCMIGAANRDPARFPEPQRFDITRPGLRTHLGFAIGPHHCLGLHLAKLEVRIALERLFARLPNCRADLSQDSQPRGYEFRKAPRLLLVWE
jgi:cytochrome P450